MNTGGPWALQIGGIPVGAAVSDVTFAAETEAWTWKYPEPCEICRVPVAATPVKDAAPAFFEVSVGVSASGAVRLAMRKHTRERCQEKRRGGTRDGR